MSTGFETRRPLALLVNPSSGGGRTRELLPRVESELDQRRMPFRVVLTESAEHAVSEADAAVSANEIPAVMSGDGLVGIVGGAIAGSEIPLGIIPGGRGNDLARVLGIPNDPEGAVEVLAAGAVREIDIGEANGQRFLGIASFGFDSDANRIANETRLIKGNLVYAFAALRALAAWKPARFELVIGERKMRFTGYTVAAANSKAYGGGMFVAPDAELDDGVFDVIMVGDSGKLGFLRGLPKVFKGTHIDGDKVKSFRAASLEVSASRPFAIYADGERLTDLPAKLRILPRALRVIAPAIPPEQI